MARVCQSVATFDNRNQLAERGPVIVTIGTNTLDTDNRWQS